MRTLPLLPRSFITALLSAFAIVLLPLAVALALAVLQMQNLAERSQLDSLRSAHFGTHSAAIQESLLAIERNLRQAQVLGAAALGEAYGAQRERLLSAVGRLSFDTEGGPQLEQATRNAETQVAQALGTGQPEAALAAFQALALAVSNTVDAAQRARAAEQRLLARMPQQASGMLLWLAAAAVPLAFALALLFAWRLGRPVRQLGQAMQRLGEGDLATPVALRGPADIVQLADRLEWLRTRLVSLESARSRFLRSISHDLKTPIAVIAEGAASLDEQLYGTLNRAQRSVVALIRHNTEKLRARIDSLLRGDRRAGDAQLAPPAGSPSRVDLVALLRAVLEDHQFASARRRLRIDAVHVEPATAIGDGDALRVAIDNLLSNAVKYSSAGGRVEISLRTRGDQVILRVSDEGPGLAPGEAARIFAPGVRGAAAQACDVPGSGQGLTIARDIAQRHGGRVWAEANKGRRGACFVLELPQVRTGETIDASA